MSTRSLFDGLLVDSLPLDNRALLYGDGVFRTLLVWDGKVAYEQLQIETLVRDAAKIGLVDIPEEIIRKALAAEAKLADFGVIRLSLIAGDSPRGYARADSPCHWLLQHSPLPDLDKRHAIEGIALCGLQWKLSTQAALAGVKHLNRLDQVMARRLLPEDYQEGLVQDEQGHWISGVMSNLFWHQDGRWHTPALQQCGVAGATRALLLECLETLGSPAVKDQHCSSDVLHEADMIFVCNSLTGLRPVGLWVDSKQQRSVWSHQNIAQFEPLHKLQQSLKHPLSHD
ncbi:MAG: aminodeoxychorismate lyase [Oceanococcus sp.]